MCPALPAKSLRRHSLSVKIASRIALAVLLFLVLPGLAMMHLSLRSLTTQSLEERERLAVLFARMCSFPMTMNDYATLEIISRDFTATPRVKQAAVLDALGATLVQASAGKAEAELAVLGQPVLSRDGVVIGQVRLVFDIAPSQQEYRQLQRFMITLCLCAALLIGLVLSYSMRQLVGTPITSLLTALRGIEAGHLDARARMHAPDELGELALQCNSMAIRLAASMASLEQANQELKTQDRLKSFFLATVSHELRTPLTSIIGYARLVQRDLSRHVAPACQENSAARQHCQRIAGNVQIIASEGQRLARLVNDLLDLSRIESGKMEWRDSAVTPAALAESARQAVHGQFATRPELALIVNMDACCQDALLHVDADRILQVLVNLLHNAAKFTGRGTVTLTVRALPDQVLFTVTDTGPGVHPEDMERIFNMFQQGQDTRHSTQNGAGLGLAISRLIVTHYQGRLWVESSPGQGSAFHVSLPRRIPEGEA